MTSFYESADQEGGDIDYTSEIQDALAAALAAQAAAELAQSSASTSATAATTQAGNASTSATNASNSASSASASAIAAGLAKDAAEAAQVASEAAQVASEAARDEVQGAISTLETFPADAAGVLTNDGAGNLSWGAGGGSFDPTASQTITGEYAFEVLPAESFLVTDDTTLVSPTYTFGVANGTFIPDNMAIIAYADNTNGIGFVANYDLITFQGQAAVNAKDAQIVSSFNGYSSALLWVSNVNVNSQISIAENVTDAPISMSTDKGAISITANGTAAADNITIDSVNGKLLLHGDSGATNGLSFTSGTNTTLYGVEGHSSLGDYWSAKAGSVGNICPNIILNKDISSGANIKLGIGTSVVYGLEITRDSGNIINEKLYTPNGSITLTQDTDTSNADVAIVTGGTGLATYNGSELATKSYVSSGTWSPSINIVSGDVTGSSSTSYYQKIGTIVQVNGRVGLTTTNTVNTVILRVSLPVTSNFTSVSNASGVAACTELSTNVCGTGDVTADILYDQLHIRIYMESSVSTAKDLTLAYSASYIII